MKKIIAGILAVAMVMSFAACGDSSSKSDSSSKASSSSAAESSSAADSSAADSSAADSSAAESTADSSAAGTNVDAAALVGAWTVSGAKKGDQEITLDELAQANGTTADAYKASMVLNEDGSIVTYGGGKQEKGTYTVDGTTLNAKDEKGEVTAMNIEGETITSKVGDDAFLVFSKDPSFTPPAEEQQTEATQGGEEQPAEQQAAEPVAE